MAVGLLPLRRRVLSLCDDNQGANPIRVASPTSKRLVILGANFRGENCASGGRASASPASHLVIVRRQPGANPIRVASPTSKRLVLLGANFRGENCASGGRASASQVSRLFEDDSKGVHGDVSQLGAVL